MKQGKKREENTGEHQRTSPGVSPFRYPYQAIWGSPTEFHYLYFVYGRALVINAVLE